LAEHTSVLAQGALERAGIVAGGLEVAASELHVDLIEQPKPRASLDSVYPGCHRAVDDHRRGTLDLGDERADRLVLVSASDCRGEPMIEPGEGAEDGVSARALARRATQRGHQ
jgi:hypothetical protein